MKEVSGWKIINPLQGSVKRFGRENENQTTPAPDTEAVLHFGVDVVFVKVQYSRRSQLHIGAVQ